MRDGKQTLAIFSDPRKLIQAGRRMQSDGNEIVEILSPIPLPELHELVSRRPSLVRWFTLVGCIAGGIFGFALQILTALQWPLPVGGKPIISMPAFVVIAFELTILFGAVAALLGFLITSRLPRFRQEAYHEGCSRSDFALVVRHDPAQFAAVEARLKGIGARDVRPIDSKEAGLENE